MNPLLKSKIKPLPPYLIDQIKAGEVIERPASLIKEILENSLDAKSTMIHIIIEGGGLNLIGIEDNGLGMGHHELPYAFQRHSTSKIQRFDDLYRLGSFGFRGEALASIASVSRISCTSDPLSEGTGGKIIIEGGRQVSLVPAKKNKTGTSLYIRDLFYNTPARLKFVKSAVSEKNAIKKILNAYLLAYPQVGFTIKWDKQEKEIYPSLASSAIEKRIGQVFFKTTTPSELLKIDCSFENYHINGFLSLKSISGYTTKNQFLLINNRYFTDRSLHTAVLRAMETLWGTGHSGAYFFKYTVPQEEVDINVHPGKMQVRFEKSSLVFSLTTTAIKSALKNNIPSNNLLPREKNKEDSFNPGDKLKGSNLLTYEGTSELPDNHFYYPICNKYLFMEWKDKTWIVNWNQLCLHYFFKKIFSLVPVQDHQTTPLLIGEPFNYPNPREVNFNWLEKRGLEFNILDEQTLILRNSPDYLHEFPLQQTIGKLLLYLKERQFELEKCQNEFLKNFQVPLFTPSFHLLKSCLECLGMEKLQLTNILCLLDEKMLDDFLKN